MGETLGGHTLNSYTYPHFSIPVNQRPDYPSKNPNQRTLTLTIPETLTLTAGIF